MTHGTKTKPKDETNPEQRQNNEQRQKNESLLCLDYVQHFKSCELVLWQWSPKQMINMSIKHRIKTRPRKVQMESDLLYEITSDPEKG